MKTKLWVMVALAALSLLAWVTPAQAAPAVLPQTNSSATLTATEFWTPENMRAAIPLDGPHRTVDAAGDRVAADLPSVVPPVTAAVTGDTWTEGGKVTATSGRVFFLFNGQKASCSGNAISSRNKSVVITAGHCVKYQGTWHTDWVFVPGYHDGQAPYGKWAAKKTLTTPQWEATEDMNYDVGIGVVSPLDGRYLTDVVGGQGIAFNQPRGQRMYGFGYPAESPFDGTKLIYCSGATFTDLVSTHDNGMRCDMTAGSSGGPWFINFNAVTGVGVQNSVTSFGYIFLPGYLFGPYFGTEVQALYRTATAS